MKDFLNSFFDLSKKERWGTIALLLIAILLVLANAIIPNLWKERKLDKIKQVIDVEEAEQVKTPENAEKREAEKIADLKKEFHKPNIQKEVIKVVKPLILDINKASSAEFKSLKGIGEVYSKRIIKFRDKLGGFYSVQQINDIYGIEDSLFKTLEPYLKVDVIELRKININEANFEELEQHPYISGNLARQIINFRSKVHLFASVEELKKLYLMNNDLFVKIQPYVKTN